MAPGKVFDRDTRQPGQLGVKDHYISLHVLVHVMLTLSDTTVHEPSIMITRHDAFELRFASNRA